MSTKAMTGKLVVSQGLLSGSLLSRKSNILLSGSRFHLPLQVSNKAVCWTSINGFALSQIPGVLARLLNAARFDTLQSKPYWMLSFLRMRKHLGLISLWLMTVHILMSLILFSPAYYGKFFIDPKASGSTKMNAVGESSLLFAVVATAFYIILGLCSLPSVGAQLTNKQWQVVYGPLAWVALAFSSIHVMVMGVKGWSEQEKWPGNLPPITITSVLLPLLAMSLKVFQVAVSKFVNHCSHKWDTTETMPLEPNYVDENGEEQTVCLSNSRSSLNASGWARAFANTSDDNKGFVKSTNISTSEDSSTGATGESALVAATPENVSDNMNADRLDDASQSVAGDESGEMMCDGHDETVEI